MTAPHDRPDVVELVEAVREFLEADVMPATEGRVRFHARIAANVLRIVERELALGPTQSLDHAAALASLGMGSDADLAEAIRAGQLDDRMAEVLEVVRQAVDAKLAVANPTYATTVDDSPPPKSSHTPDSV